MTESSAEAGRSTQDAASSELRPQGAAQPVPAQAGDLEAVRLQLRRVVERLDRLERAPEAPPPANYQPERAWMPAGHFYSPIHSREDLERELRWSDAQGLDSPAGIDMQLERQVEALRFIAECYADCGYVDREKRGKRYFAENNYYPFGDALVLQAFLRHLRPKRLIEVGSGFSSAAALDTIDQHLGGAEGDPDATRCTFIEPHPERIHALLAKDDRKRHDVRVAQVQEVPLELFDELGDGDLLVIDSSHVSKAGSDVNYLFFQVLPRLVSGVRVHVHDVIWPLSYPRPWLEEGRAWNESYVLRAFLQFNTEFEVEFSMSYMLLQHYARIKSDLPRLYAAPGSAFWMRRV